MISHQQTWDVQLVLVQNWNKLQTRLNIICSLATEWTYVSVYQARSIWSMDFVKEESLHIST